MHFGYNNTRQFDFAAVFFFRSLSRRRLYLSSSTAPPSVVVSLLSSYCCWCLNRPKPHLLLGLPTKKHHRHEGKRRLL